MNKKRNNARYCFTLKLLASNTAVVVNVSSNDDGTRYGTENRLLSVASRIISIIRDTSIKIVETFDIFGICSAH